MLHIEEALESLRKEELPNAIKLVTDVMTKLRQESRKEFHVYQLSFKGYDFNSLSDDMEDVREIMLKYDTKNLSKNDAWKRLLEIGVELTDLKSKLDMMASAGSKCVGKHLKEEGKDSEHAQYVGEPLNIESQEKDFELPL